MSNQKGYHETKTIELIEELDVKSLPKTQITSPEEVFQIFQYLQSSEREKLIAMHMTSEGMISMCELIALGSTNKLITDTGLILRGPVALTVPGLIIVHNHPSGNPEPTPEDIELTHKVQEGSKLFNITVLDHIIIGKECYVSMKERDLLK